MHGSKAANQRKPSKVQMTLQAQLQSHKAPNQTTKEFNQFREVICKTADHFLSKHPFKNFDIPEPVMTSLFISWLNSDFDQWLKRLNNTQQTAERFYRDPYTYWKTIAFGISHQEFQKEITNIPPSVDREKYSPNHKQLKPSTAIAPTIGTGFNLKKSISLIKEWRLDSRWEQLLPCAKTLFCYLIFRTYRNDNFRKIKQALKNGETWFPYCLTGIKSLEKVLTYHKGSSTKLKNYKKTQIKKALRELWDQGFVNQIFQGYQGMGAGKYHVFLSPKMSAAFNRPRQKSKKT